MKAARLAAPGGPEHIVIEDVPVPEPAAGEVLVAVRAAAITPRELTWTTAPATISHEISGVVAKAGPGVTELSPGDEVFGLIGFDRQGGASEYAAVPDDQLARKPSPVAHIDAAATTLSGLTAWQALFDHAHVVSGDNVLVQGGSGGVGLFAVQLARYAGAQVTATVGKEDLAFVEGRGANHAVDYKADDPARFGPFDAVIDTVGGDVLTSSLGLLDQDGTLVSTARRPPATELPGGRRAIFFIVEPNRAQLRTLAELLASGELVPVIGERFPLEEARRAFERALEHVRGKVVLDLPPY
jgi:NADPH:quinone reductase-like Zn-dependent oxidoreductase